LTDYEMDSANYSFSQIIPERQVDDY
jgi:hypothetical protein